MTDSAREILRELLAEALAGTNGNASHVGGTAH